MSIMESKQEAENLLVGVELTDKLKQISLQMRNCRYTCGHETSAVISKYDDKPQRGASR